MIPGLGIPATAAMSACTSGGGGSDGGSPAQPAVFVIDSTGSLISFDAQGNRIASVALPTPIGNINGGGIGLAAGNLYVTVGRPTNSVVSFTTGLSPNPLGAGAFSGLDVPRGIVYDAPHSFFFVGNGGASVDVYDPSGSAVQDGLFPDHYGPSGVAYDPDDDFVWVANYVGAPVDGTPQFGVQDYEFNGSAAHVHDYSTEFVGPAHTEPYSVAVCAKGPGVGETIVVAGFIDDGSGLGTADVRAFTTSGTRLGRAIQPVSKPYAISCDGQGQIYVADSSGLYIGMATGFVRPAAEYVGNPGAFSVTPPVYGVLAVGSVGGAQDGGGAAGGGGGGAGGGGTAGGGGGGGSPVTCDGGDAATATPDAGQVCQDAGETPGANGEVVTVSPGANCVLAPGITADTDLSPAQCPVYGAPNGLTVGNPSGPAPTLTLEPGTTIAFGAGTNLIVGTEAPGQATSGPGTLLVKGTPCQPVVFTALAGDAGTLAPGAWGGVTFEQQTTASTVSNLIVQYGGGQGQYIYSNTPDAGSGPLGSVGSVRLDGYGGNAGTPADFTVVLDGVTVSHNATVGFGFFGPHTGPGPGSGALRVTDWPGGYAFDPFLIHPDAAGLLANVSLVTTQPGGYVHISDITGFGNVDTSETWPSIPIPYVLGLPNEQRSSLDEVLNVVATTAPDGGTGGTTLTIAAPNTLEFGNGFQIAVGTLDSLTDSAGFPLASLVANGQPCAPIVFEGLGGTPQPGIWQGINFPNGVSSQTPASITYATIDSANFLASTGSQFPDGIIAGAINVAANGCAVCLACYTSTTNIEHVTFSNLPTSFTDPQTQLTTKPYAILATFIADGPGVYADNSFQAGNPTVYTYTQCEGD